ncbi:MAG: alpha/beta hydrolase [Chloroflexi bacterium]|nr:alpha/beta hydrolase [Chloroflexota bacterium]
MAEVGKVVIDGIEIRELVIGDGAPVLMVHGWGARIELLEPLALRLSRLGHRCYMIDLPGFGESAEPPAPFTIFDYAAFCIAYLDKRQLASVNYFGHSLGGRIGLILGSDYCERLRNLALSNSAGLKAAAALHTRMRQSFYKSIRRSLAGMGAKSAADGLRALYNRRFASDDYRAASPVMRKTLVNIVNQDLLEQAGRVAIPTILIWGDADRETPLWMGHKLEAAIPDAALIIHAGAGHYAYLDFPDKTAGIIDALFRADSVKKIDL